MGLEKINLISVTFLPSRVKIFNNHTTEFVILLEKNHKNSLCATGDTDL